MLPDGPQQMKGNHKESYSGDRSKGRASRVAARGAKLMVRSGRLYVSGRPWVQCLFWESFDNCQEDHNRLWEATKNSGGCLSCKSQRRQNEECFCESRLYIERNKVLISNNLHHVTDFSIHICHTFSVPQFFPFTILNLRSKFCLSDRTFSYAVWPFVSGMKSFPSLQLSCCYCSRSF